MSCLRTVVYLLCSYLIAGLIIRPASGQITGPIDASIHNTVRFTAPSDVVAANAVMTGK